MLDCRGTQTRNSNRVKDGDGRALDGLDVKSVLAEPIAVQRKTARARFVDMIVAYFSHQAYLALCVGDMVAEYFSCSAVEQSRAGIGRDVVNAGMRTQAIAARGARNYMINRKPCTRIVSTVALHLKRWI
jgi:hypothetical protein